ncbi:MAG: UDP-N-acetylmuramate dehydrogenase [Patescibacteria group bacterium]
MFDQNVFLNQVSHYKIGGKAKYFFEAKNSEEIITAINQAKKANAPVFVLAGGSNVLISDEGFDGLVLRPAIKFMEFLEHGIRVGAGVSVSDVLQFALENDFKGLEWAAGLPGTIGGAIRGNAGAFGGEIKDIVKSVTSVDVSLKNPKIIKRSGKECFFDYRTSIFKKEKGKEIITEAVLNLIKGNHKEIEEEIKKNIDYRLMRHPMEYPSLGSTFKNIAVNKINQSNIDISAFPVKNDPFPILPVAYLISEAGLKGVSYGGAMISPKHPNFIVNVLEATAKDVENLIALTKSEVKKKYNLDLEEEIEYLN